MERKSMGSFIAALRKANGLTQKDLAEQLNLSDKTVSRWERDENAPDLSLIPVLAELFGVTCDELLCGERKPKQDTDSAPRKAKQMKRILDDSLRKFQSKTYIAMTITALGVVVGLVANFGFLRAQIGFFLSLVFFVIAAVYQCICGNNFTYSLRSDDLADTQPYQAEGFTWTVRSFLWLATALLVMVPLLLFGDVYSGIAASSFFPFALLIGVAVFLAYFALLKGFFAKIALKYGIYVLNSALEKQQRLQKLKNKAVALTAVGCLVTLLVQGVYVGTCSGQTFAKYESFSNIDDFVAYMALESERVYYNEYGTVSQEPSMSVGDPTYYDQWGNEISQYESRTTDLYDSRGNVIGTYQHNNEAVVGTSFRWNADGTVQEIRTYLSLDMRDGWRVYDSYGNLLSLGYPIALCLGLVFYGVKRKGYV